MVPVLIFLIGIAASAVSAEESKTPQIAFLLMGTPPVGLTLAFDQSNEGLRELGWIENENVVIEYRWAGEA